VSLEEAAMSALRQIGGMVAALGVALVGLSAANPGVAVVSDPVPAAAAPSASFVPIRPVRLVDRAGVSGSSSPTCMSVAASGVPDDAVSVALDVTAAAPTAPGHLALFPDPGTADPTPHAVSTVDVQVGADVSNAAFAELGAGRRICYDLVSAGTARVVVDVTGYATAGVGLGVAQRLIDGRTGDGGTALAAHPVRSVVRDGVLFDAVALAALSAVPVSATAPGAPSVHRSAVDSLPGVSTLADARSATAAVGPGAPVAADSKVAPSADTLTTSPTIVTAATTGTSQGALAVDMIQGYIVPTPAPTPAPVRLAALQPFSSTAPWNTSLGSGAIFQAKTDPATANFLGGSPAFNSVSWSVAVYQASMSDPLATLVDTRMTVTNPKDDVSYPVRIPVNAFPTGGTDKHVAIIDPNGTVAWEIYAMTKVDDLHWKSTRVVRTDLLGDGLKNGARASSTSVLAGLIRKDELKAGSIRHALMIGIPDTMLELGPVWPANTQDSGAQATYSGRLPMGSLVAIPPDVNVDAMPLSAEGRAVAHALQNYGAYVVIRADTVALYGELACDQAQVTRARNDWSKLYPYMRVVTNSSSTNVGGGGIRRDTLLPNPS